MMFLSVSKNLDCMMAESIKLYNLGNSAVEFSIFWVVTLNMKVENHVGSKLPLHRL